MHPRCGCGPGTNGSLLPHPAPASPQPSPPAGAGLGRRPRGRGRDASVTWQSGEGPAALPKASSAGGARSPPYMRPAAPRGGEAGRAGPGEPRGGGRPPAGRRRSARRSPAPRCGARSSRTSFPLRYCTMETCLLHFSFVFLFVPFSRSCPKSSASRQRHRQALACLFSELGKARSDQNRSLTSLRPLLLQQKLNPGPGSQAVLRSSYRSPIPLSGKKTPTGAVWRCVVPADPACKSSSPTGKQ